MEKILLPFYDGSIPSELSADYILPDTYPDVKRILRVRARPVSIGRFINAGRLEYNGAVDYIVTFSSENESSPDSLHSVHFAAEYSGLASPDDSSLLAESCEIIISPTVSACSARLQNPRKLSLKSTVITDVKLSKPTSCAPKLEGVLSSDEERKLERLCETRPTLIERSFLADHRQISENLEPDPSAPAIDEIITCDAEIHFCEAKPSLTEQSFTVALKGEVLIDCVYKAQTEPGDYRSFTRKLPLSFVVGADDFAEHFKAAVPGTLCALACGIPAELNASVGENSYGERRVLELDLAFDVELRLIADVSSCLTLDMYSTERVCECGSRRLDLCSLGKSVSSNFSVSESVPRSALGLPEADDTAFSIVDTQVDVKLTGATVNRGRAQLIGEASVSCLLGDRHSFTPVEFKLPIKCELSVGDLDEPVSFISDALASDLRTRIDQNRISCDFEVALNVVFLKRARFNVIESLKLLPEPLDKSTADRSSLLLCYPSPDESLWQIAKRYGTTRSAICAANPDGTDNANVIVIPLAHAVPKV